MGCDGRSLAFGHYGKRRSPSGTTSARCGVATDWCDWCDCVQFSIACNRFYQAQTHAASAGRVRTCVRCEKVTFAENCASSHVLGRAAARCCACSVLPGAPSARTPTTEQSVPVMSSFPAASLTFLARSLANRHPGRRMLSIAMWWVAGQMVASGRLTGLRNEVGRNSQKDDGLGPEKRGPGRGKAGKVFHSHYGWVDGVVDGVSRWGGCVIGCVDVTIYIFIFIFHLLHAHDKNNMCAPARGRSRSLQQHAAALRHLSGSVALCVRLWLCEAVPVA